MKLRLLVLMMMVCATFAVAQVQQPKIYGAVNPENQEIGSGGYFSINADGTGYSLKEFDPNPITGFLPQGEIMAGTDGRLYGTASSGGDFMQGVVYSFKADGTDYKVIHHFGSVSNDGASPIGNLVQLPTGELVGVTFSGGSNMRGTIYKVKPDGSGYLVVKHFVNLEGESPRDGLILASNGKLYGTTSLGTSGASGGIYTISQDGTGYSVLHSFNSGSGIPFSGVIQASDGILYGTTLLDAGSNPKQGTIYKVNLDGTGYNEFHLFASSDGANPQSGVIEGQDGNLYGLIFGDGAINHNIVYKIKKDGTGFGVIHAFTNDLHAQGVALAQTPDGFLFGMGQSTLFKLMPDGSLFQSLATFNGEAGSLPAASLTLINNNLWGTMSQGTIQGYGSIISVTLAGTLTPVLVFGPHAELGSNPGSPIRSKSGAMIGISNYGGQHSKGIIYRIDESLNYTRVLDLPEVPLHDGLFDNDLIQAPDNSLLGIGYPGSTADWGFIFSVREDGSQFNVVHEFGYASGPITMGTDGFVYGTSPDGGAFNHGLIYKMKPDGSSYTELHDFDTDTNGASPSSIMMASNGFLYGVTGQAGNNNIGTIFKLKPDGTDYQVIHHQAEIYSIQFGLTEFDGALFGVSYAGGDNGLGAIFTIRLDGSGFNILHNLDAQDGASPSGKIAIGNDGVIYGTNAAYGANGHGTFYSMKTDGSGFDVLHDFVYGSPSHSLVVIDPVQDQTIQFGLLPNKVVSDAPFQLAATSSSGLPVVYTSNNPNVATINDNTITIVGAGKALITASQPGNGHFLAAQNVVRELVVNKKSQTIVFDPLPQRPRDSFLLNAKASSELTVIFTSDNANVASIAGNTITVRGVGTAVISASQSGDATYEPALTVSQALVVQVITAVEDARGRMSSVYPNPSRGVVNIYNPALQGIKEIQVVVIGLAGNTQQVMQPQQVSEDHFQLDMSDLPSGMYMLRINGSDNVLKVVKQ